MILYSNSLRTVVHKFDYTRKQQSQQSKFNILVFKSAQFITGCFENQRFILNALLPEDCMAFHWLGFM